MFKEKLLISSSPRTYIIADPSKMVSKLGSRFPVPVEIYPDALTHAAQALESLTPKEMKLRMAQGKDGPYHHRKRKSDPGCLVRQYPRQPGKFDQVYNRRYRKRTFHAL